MRLLLVLLVALLAMPAAARAASEPALAPIPDWVEMLPIPDANPALNDRPAQMLLMNAQSRFGSDRNDHFVDMAMRIQTQQGLQAFGNIVLPWQPDQAELIVHKVEIIRGGTVIDLLANGRRFTTLRRENGLESAVLDGTLTAVMQADGLAVGDVLHMTYTMRRLPGALPLRAEQLFLLRYGNPIGRYHVRQIWPRAMNLRWQGRGELARPTVRQTDLGTELVLDLRNAEGPEAPENAPTRFALHSTLQIVDPGEWNGISAIMAPLYDRARAPAPDSPLRAEIARIAAAHPDAASRALAALRLVQDEVRYFALVMGDGNYVPSTANETWTRRYGDCKGKTALLLALLDGLGIEAEPVLVNTQIGDTLGERLPQMGLFNHVLVGVRIGGRSYWLDGTRTGDRSLVDLASSTFSWGLPVRAAGAALEPLPWSPPSQPLTDIAVTYDGSHGFEGPIPVHVEVTYRGDLATGMRLAVSQVGRDQFLTRMRDSDMDLPGDEGEIERIDLREETASGDFILVMDGETTLSWRRLTDGMHFSFDNDPIDWDADFERPAGQDAQAPFALQVPMHATATETVILPDGGRGFTLDGQSFERIVAGTRISRQLRLEGGRAVARSVFQRIAREMPAAEAAASLTALAEITDDVADLVGPSSMRIQVADGDAEAPQTAASAGDLINSGMEKLQNGEAVEALAELDRAVALAPDWARAHAARAIALGSLNRLDEAETALATAMSRDQADYLAYFGYGRLHMTRGRLEDAIRSLTRSLELDGDMDLGRQARAEAYLGLGRVDEALADLDAILAQRPDDLTARSLKARVLTWRHDDSAPAAIDAAVEAAHSDPGYLAWRGRMLGYLGLREESARAHEAALAALDAGTTIPDPLRRARIRAQFLADAGRAEQAFVVLDEAVAAHPDDAELLNDRCWFQTIRNARLEQALSDCDRAVAAAPDNASYLDSRALVRFRLGQLDAAIADANAALDRDPTHAPTLMVRALARLQTGDRAGADSDLAAARRIEFDIDSKYRSYGLNVPAAPGAANASGEAPVVAAAGTEGH